MTAPDSNDVPDDSLEQCFQEQFWKLDEAVDIACLRMSFVNIELMKKSMYESVMSDILGRGLSAEKRREDGKVSYWVKPYDFLTWTQKRGGNVQWALDKLPASR